MRSLENLRVALKDYKADIGTIHAIDGYRRLADELVHVQTELRIIGRLAETIVDQVDATKDKGDEILGSTEVKSLERCAELASWIIGGVRGEIEIADGSLENEMGRLEVSHD